MIGCFVVDRKYFEEIGLLDEGMEIYGGENVELGIRVSWLENLYLISCTAMETTCQLCPFLTQYAALYQRLVVGHFDRQGRKYPVIIY